MEPDVTCRTSSTSVAVPCRMSARVNASSAYLAVADELGAATIAFPLVSAGIYHWPNDDAVRHALTVLTSAETTVGEATMVLFDEATLAVAQRIGEEFRFS